MVPKYRRHVNRTDARFVAFEIMLITDNLRMWFPECYSHAFGDDMAASATELLNYTTRLCKATGDSVPMARYRYACANTALSKLDDFEFKLEAAYMRAMEDAPRGVNYINGKLLSPFEVQCKIEQAYNELMPLLSQEQKHLSNIASAAESLLNGQDAFWNFDIAEEEDIVAQDSTTATDILHKMRDTAGWLDEAVVYGSPAFEVWLEDWLLRLDIFIDGTEGYSDEENPEGEEQQKQEEPED